MGKKKKDNNDYWKKKAKSILNELEDEVRWLDQDLAEIYSKTMQEAGCKEQIYDKLNGQFCWRRIGERKKLQQVIGKFHNTGIC